MINFRIAIAPSGFLHLGNFFIIIINYFLKNKLLSNIFIRFDDTNKKNFFKKSKMFIFKSLKKIGIFIKKIKHQSENFFLYIKNIFNVKQKKNVFKKNYFNNKIKKKNLCYSRIINIKYCLIFFIENNFGIFKNKNINKKIVLIKKNGISIYNYSSILDDDYNSIKIIIRGKEWIDQISSQLIINNEFKINFLFHHLPNLINLNNKKISKRYFKKNTKNNFFIFKYIKNYFNLKIKKNLKYMLLEKNNKIIKKINNFMISYFSNFFNKIKLNFSNFFKKNNLVKIFKENYILNNLNFVKKKIKDFKNVLLNNKFSSFLIKIKKKYESL